MGEWQKNDCHIISQIRRRLCVVMHSTGFSDSLSQPSGETGRSLERSGNEGECYPGAYHFLMMDQERINVLLSMCLQNRAVGLYYVVTFGVAGPQRL
jgi:hypothetical protein